MTDVWPAGLAAEVDQPHPWCAKPLSLYGNERTPHALLRLGHSRPLHERTHSSGFFSWSGGGYT